MKTSNKLLVIIISLIVILILSAAVFSRLFMSPEMSLANKYSNPQNSSTQTIKGNGTQQHIKKLYPKVSNLEINGPFTIDLQPGDATILTIYSDENIIQGIVTELQDDTLRISLSKSIKISSDTPIRLSLNSNSINNIVLLGNTNFTAENLTRTNFNLYAHGNTKAQLSGKLAMLNLSMHGQSELNAKDLLSQAVNLDVHGQTTAIIYAENNLNINATGNNTITYYGSPENIVKTISGNNQISAGG